MDGAHIILYHTCSEYIAILQVELICNSIADDSLRIITLNESFICDSNYSNEVLYCSDQQS